MSQQSSLYWKDLEIIPGMLLEVDLLQNEVFSSNGNPVRLWWKIMSFGSRNNDEAYLDYSTGKKYALKKVIKKRKLQAKLSQAELLQLPACSEFMVVQEFYDGESADKRCYNLDMLATVRNIKVIQQNNS